jgi:hypothetical protein
MTVPSRKGVLASDAVLAGRLRIAAIKPLINAFISARRVCPETLNRTIKRGG